MQIKDSRILIFGGWGLVGSAICHELMQHEPAQLIVSSLRESEAKDACEQLRKEYKDCDPNMFVPKWGNIFTRQEWKDENWGNVLSDPEMRRGAIEDIFYELNDELVERSAIYKLVEETKPDIIIDCINTATAIAYLDTYNTTLDVMQKLEQGGVENENIERLISSAYIPQLIRHVQLLNKGMNDVGTKLYLKIGTSGTGGMGMNIPYTHSEERPSRVLMSKTAVAGAQSLLLFLLARTPGGPVVKEIKPTATIAWKRIAYDTVKKGGRPIKLVDMTADNQKAVEGSFKFDDFSGVDMTDEDYKSIFIDTGENGIFSRGEFEAISSIGQMEMVTPEEIATYAVFEIAGGNSGREVMQGLDAFTLGPTYRGGFLQNTAVKKIDQLEQEIGVDSIAFELLGPPRLSKLLFEAYMIKKIAGSMKNAVTMDPAEISAKAAEMVKENKKLRSEMLSIGLVVLMPDGKNYLRGKDVKIPVRRGVDELEFTPENIEQWCFEGWLDLRAENFKAWQERLERIMAQANEIPMDETSSRFTYTRDYWENFETINEGKVCGWVFEYEDKGWRFKR